MALHASCHCGAVRLELARRPRSLTECNCSICRRYAARWAYANLPSVRIHAALGALSSYAYSRTFRYHFCKRCGCVTHYTRPNTTRDDRIAVNARMMSPDDLAGIPVKRLNTRRSRA